MSDIHSRIIAATAKAELAPLGFRQKGGSRLWLADRGTWLNVVEFTPSQWSKSVSLMNGAHWLWVGTGFMSFDEVVSSNVHAQFETQEQFERAASDIAKVARAKALEIEERFSSFEAIADFIIERARSSPDRMALSWWGYEAGIASGLIGKFEDAVHFLQNVADERVSTRAARLLPLIGHPEAFKCKIYETIAQKRARLKLAVLNNQLF